MRLAARFNLHRVKHYLKILSTLGAVVATRLQATFLEICVRFRMGTDRYDRAFH